MKKFEHLNEEELKDIANHYQINGADNMNREEIIEHLSRLMPEFAKKVVKQEKEVKTKITKRAIMYNLMFLSFLMIAIFSTLTIMIERFYFYPKLLGVSFTSDIYGMFLTLASVGWSVYVYYRWLKTGIFHIFMIIGVLLALGFFIHSCINNYNSVVWVYNKTHNPKYEFFTIYFYIKIAIMSALCLTCISMFIWRAL